MNKQMNREVHAGSSPEAEEAEVSLGDTIRALLPTLKRRKWYILVPLVIGAVGASLAALRLPNEYVSEAIIGVTQQQVSERYVSSDAGPMLKALANIRQDVLSRASLMKIIEEFDLYGNRAGVSQQDLADRLQSELTIVPLETSREEVMSVQVSFKSPDPQIAQKVTSRVVSVFMNETLKQRDVQLESNTDFLNERVREAAAKLADQEARLQSYKSRNLSELPEQQVSNLGVLTDLRSRLHAIDPELEQARRGLRAVENQVSDRLSRLQLDRSELLKKYTAQMPIVAKLDGEIIRYSALREFFGADGLSARARQVLAVGDDAQVSQLRNQAEGYVSEIEKLRRQQSDLEGQINDYQRKVTAAPLREQEQSSILRDYNLLKADYESLKAKQLSAGLTTDLEANEGGQKFRLIEPASLPIRPIGPKRLRISLGGAVGGLVLGLVFGFVRGTVSTSFHSEKEVARVFRVPLVLGIPEILTPGEQSALVRKRVFEWVAGTTLILLVLSAEVYVYIKG
ncbi:MAG: Wzz/FepE/Etk N-terminal domain-containing protein [Bryobacteraceae bacterium]